MDQTIKKNNLPASHRFSYQAMATLFEIMIENDDRNYAEQAAWEAFRQLDHLEQALSRFIKNSDINRINGLRANESLIIGPETFECLRQCSALYQQTAGAFDITIGVLMRCWLNPDKTLRQPSPAEINRARQLTGMTHLQLDATSNTVKLLTEAIDLDLGGFGKGYAVDKMAELLLEWDLDTFLIHGGTSSVLAQGAPATQNGWPLSISHPENLEQTLEYIHLRNRALSGSGLQKGQHILNPRTGYPLTRNRTTWAFAPTAAVSDALSTAFMIMELDEIEDYCARHAAVQAIVLESKAGTEQILHFGFN